MNHVRALPVDYTRKSISRSAEIWRVQCARESGMCAIHGFVKHTPINGLNGLLCEMENSFTETRIKVKQTKGAKDLK